MNIRDLQYFVTAARLKHFGKAADACHTTQPTLSMQIKKLEETLGVMLFERGGKKIMVTPVGEEIALRAEKILEDIDALKKVARHAQDPFCGEFRLGIFPTLAPYYLPFAVPALKAWMPHLHLFLVEEKTAVLMEGLRHGTLDAALLALPLPEKGFEVKPLFQDAFLVAVPQNHPLCRHERLRLEDLQQEQLLLLEEGHCLRSQALEICHLIGSREQSTFQATSLETLRHMIAAGGGITLLPAIAQREGDGLCYIPFEPPVPTRTIGLVWRNRTPRQAVIEKLFQLATLSLKHPPSPH